MVKQKRKARAWAGAAHLRAVRRPGGGVLSRHVCSAQMTAGSAVIIRLTSCQRAGGS